MRPAPLGILFCFVSCVVLCLASHASADSQHVVIRDDLAPFPKELMARVDATRAALANPPDAKELITKAKEQFSLTDLKPEAKDFYCIIHLLRWSDPATDNKQTVTLQNWYLYHSGKWSQEDFTTAKRLLESKHAWLMYVHFNAVVTGDAPNYAVRYEIDITKKTPANLQNLYALAQLFVSAKEGVPERRNFWGIRPFNIDYVPSSVTVTGKFVKRPDNGEAPLSFGDPQTFEDEGLYYWDVSVAVPIKKISELKFDDASNTVTAQKVEKQNIFALVNFYYPRHDLRSTSNSLIPHFVAGVAIANRPLHRILLGAGWGFQFAQIYTGALLVKQDSPNTLKAGDTATPGQLASDLRGHYETQFSIGINLPVRGVLDTLKKAQKK